MGMSFENPVYCQFFRMYKFDQHIGRMMLGSSGLGVVVEHRIDNGAVPTWLVEYNIADRPRNWIKECLDIGLHHRLLELFIFVHYTI